MTIKQFVKLELGYIAFIMRKTLGIKFTICFIAHFPNLLFFNL